MVFMRFVSVIGRCAALFRAQRLEGTGLGGCQYPYITAVCRHPGISQDELGRQLYIPKCNVSRQLSSLESQGFVTRRRSESDGRVLEVYPTEKAEAVLPVIRNMLKEWNAYLTEDVTEEEQAVLDRVMERMLSRAEAYAGGALSGRKEP